MEHNSINRSEADALSKKAENLLKKKPPLSPGGFSALSEKETNKLIKELEKLKKESEKLKKELKQSVSEAKVFYDKYTSLCFFAPSGYLILSETAEIQELNFYSADLLGKDRTELIYTRFDRYVSEESRPAFLSFLSKVFEKRAVENFDMVLSACNEAVYVNLNGVVLPENKCCLITIIDITRRKKAEDAIRESEKRYRTLMETFYDMVYITDYNDKMLFANLALTKLTSYTIEDFNRKEKGFNFVYPEDTGKVDQFVNEFKKSSEEYSGILESRFVKADGDIRWHSTIMSKVDFSGLPALQFICRDITESKRAEQALSAKEAFNYALFSYNPVATAVVDHEGRILKTNLMQKKFGTSNPKTGDIMYKDYARYHSTDMYSEMMECIKKKETKEFVELKYHERYLTITIVPFEEGAIITCIDATPRKKAEEALKQKTSELEACKKLLAEREKEITGLKKEIPDLPEKTG